ncbi:TadE/TadG family type IV pilus assembly protein [Novosphingobium sp. Gsoil 351]|uniref:TadE/TadG family type IV pilus assembly protein n=1 Tax=Novosphingobium sp. Gsoil 351 TaxID=2675225 RepID=UPI0012B44FBA|nr:TadE/TadG family type IV pilus assembly protein [Novosphingobium sp. Gsoil 351]QGN54466.1 pilus assembly protein [Novosphingobium sp. Gsoil 351]
MSGTRPFWRNDRGASAAEFALILPIFLTFLLGLTDVGRFAWAFAQLEKATQAGARWAVATDVIPSGLITYSYADQGGITQGTIVPISAFPGVHCVASTAGAPTCTCKTGGTCAFGTTASQTAFDNLIGRMRQVYPSIRPENLVVDYDWSGLGFSGDPNGPDVAPIVTVSVQNMSFPMLFMLGTSVALPTSRYSMTLEDGQGTVSN